MSKRTARGPKPPKKCPVCDGKGSTRDREGLCFMCEGSGINPAWKIQREEKKHAQKGI